MNMRIIILNLAILIALTGCNRGSASPQGRDLEKRDEYGNTALQKAVRDDNVQAVKVLLDAGANVEARTGGGMTPLIRASASDDREIVRLLLAKGAEVNGRNNSCETDFSEHAYLADIDML